MREIVLWFERGGTVMAALAGVAVTLAFLVTERLWATSARLRALRRGRRDPRGAAAALPPVTGLRRMGLIRACIVVAPLLGLLGTVNGMIDTFTSILAGGYVPEMSAGICKALQTTQYGLAIAAPGLLAERVLLRRQRQLENALRRAGLVRQKEPTCAAAS